MNRKEGFFFNLNKTDMMGLCVMIKWREYLCVPDQKVYFWKFIFDKTFYFIGPFNMREDKSFRYGAKTTITGVKDGSFKFKMRKIIFSQLSLKPGIPHNLRQRKVPFLFYIVSD